MAKDRGAYQYPDPIGPYDYRCIKVYVPNHTLYLGAFWRAYEYFSTWSAWQADAAHTAKDVADIWKVAFQMSRDAFEGDGCEETMDIRQKPGEPCILEKTTDGETWIPFADITLCPPTIALASDGKTLVHWCPTCGPGGVPGWHPVPNPDEDYDPANDDPQTPLEDWPTGGSDAACVYAANATEGFKTVLDRVDIGLATGILATAVYTSLEVGQFINKFLPKGENEILETLATLATLDYETFHADYDGFDWQDLINKLCCFYSEDGTVTPEDYTIGLAAMEEETSPVWQVVKTMILAVGINGLNNAADYAGIREAECDCDCDPSDNCVDFEETEGDYTLMEFGEYVPGIGFRGVLNTTYGDLYSAQIETGPVDAGEISIMHVDWTNSGGFKIIQVVVNSELVLNITGGAAGYRSEEIIFDPPVEIEMVQISVTQSGLDDGLIIKKVCYGV